MRLAVRLGVRLRLRLRLRLRVASTWHAACCCACWCAANPAGMQSIRWMPPVSWTSFVLSSSLRLSWISWISCAVIAGAGAAAIVAVEGGYPAGDTPWPSRPAAAPDSGVKGGYPAGGAIGGGNPAGGALEGDRGRGGRHRGGMAQLDAAKGRPCPCPCAPSWTMPAW